MGESENRRPAHCLSILLFAGIVGFYLCAARAYGADLVPGSDHGGEKKGDSNRNNQRVADPNEETVTTSNNHFKFTAKKRPAEKDGKVHSFEITVFYRGSQIQKEESHIENDQNGVVPMKLLKNIPAPGCETIVAKHPSYGGMGMVSLEFSYDMAITCGDRDHLFEGGGTLETDDYGKMFEDVDGDGVKELRLHDGYWLTANGEGSKPAEGADFFRYARWTPDGWQLTAPGELSGAYAKYLQELLSDKGKGVSLALSAAYYSVMSGQDDEVARKILGSKLPDEWRSNSKEIFEKMKTALSKREGIDQRDLIRVKSLIPKERR